MDSIIFDLDGTLWDSRGTVVAAWNEVMNQYDDVYKEITKDDLKKTMGLPFDEVARRLLPNLNKEMQVKVLQDCCEVENSYLAKQGGILYDDVEEIVKVLAKQYKLFIVSNCQDGYIEAFYKYHQLEKYFDDYENPGRTGLSKGENIKLIIDRNNITKPIYVGDTVGDQKAAKDAGIPFVYARYGFGEVTDYDYVMDRFSELVEIF